MSPLERLTPRPALHQKSVHVPISARPSTMSVIAPKVRAFTDIDSLHHCTITPKPRAHPDIGQTRISNINGLASAAEAGSCKKCRVTGKYNGRGARKLHSHDTTASACCFVSNTETAPTTITAVIIIGSSTAGLRALGMERDRDRDREITPPHSGPRRDPRHQGDHTDEHRRDHHHHDRPADGFTRSRVQEDYVLVGPDGKYWSAMGGRIGTEAEALAHLAPEIGKPDAASEAATAAKPLTPPPAA